MRPHGHELEIRDRFTRFAGKSGVPPSIAISLLGWGGFALVAFVHGLVSSNQTVSTVLLGIAVVFMIATLVLINRLRIRTRRDREDERGDKCRDGTT